MASPAAPILPPPSNPFRLLAFAPSVWYRVHPYDAASGEYAPGVFNASGLGNARFSPLIDPATNKPIPTIYAANDERGAIAEVVLHDVPTPSAGYLHDIDADYRNNLHLSRIRLGKLMLVNLTATGLKAAGLSPADLFDGEKDDYDRTRKWALWIWQNMPQAQGLHWMSKRDNRREVVMLFGDRVGSGDVSDDRNSHPLQVYEDAILELLDEMGAGVYPAL